MFHAKNVFGLRFLSDVFSNGRSKNCHPFLLVCTIVCTFSNKQLLKATKMAPLPHSRPSSQSFSLCLHSHI